MSKKLVPRKPCPFCKSIYLYVNSIYDWESLPCAYEATCFSCGAKGPRKKTNAKAVHAWENRK